MYRKVMLSLTLLSLILLSLIAWKVGVFKEIADLPFSTLVSNMVRNTYFSGMACSIISVVVIYKWQVRTPGGQAPLTKCEQKFE